jgi:phosphotransferase system IIB component
MDQLILKLKDAKNSHPNSAPLIDMIQGTIETNKQYHLRVTVGIFDEDDIKTLSEELKGSFYFTKETDYNYYIISWEREPLHVSHKLFNLFH